MAFEKWKFLEAKGDGWLLSADDNIRNGSTPSPCRGGAGSAAVGGAWGCPSGWHQWSGSMGPHALDYRGRRQQDHVSSTTASNEGCLSTEGSGVYPFWHLKCHMVLNCFELLVTSQWLYLGNLRKLFEEGPGWRKWTSQGESLVAVLTVLTVAQSASLLSMKWTPKLLIGAYCPGVLPKVIESSNYEQKSPKPQAKTNPRRYETRRSKCSAWGVFQPHQCFSLL